MRVISFLAILLFIAYAMANTDPEATFPWVLDLEKVPENPPHPYFVEFYSPYCGWCKKVAHTVKNLGGVLRDSKVKVAKINCHKHSDECDKAGVEGYPSFRVIRTEKGKTVSTDYEGQRTIEEFTGFLTKTLGEKEVGPIRDVNRKITSETELKEIITNPKTVKIVAVTADWCGHCKKLYPILKELTTEILGTNFDIDIVNADGTNAEIKKLLASHKVDIKGFPTIVYFDKEGKPSPYTSSRTVRGFVEFLRNKTGWDIPVPEETVQPQPTQGQPGQPGKQELDSAFLAAKYYENLARIGIENAKLVREVQTQLDEALLLMRSIANVELPENVQKKIDERKAEREQLEKALKDAETKKKNDL